MKVLIVEDDPNLRMLWRAVFGDRGFDVTEAASLPAAAAALGRTRYDLLLLDLYLGRDTGLKLVGMAADMAPDTRIIIVSGAAQERLPDPAGNIHAVLRKPVDIEDLLEIVDSALAGAMPAPVTSRGLQSGA